MSECPSKIQRSDPQKSEERTSKQDPAAGTPTGKNLNPWNGKSGRIPVARGGNSWRMAMSSFDATSISEMPARKLP